MIGVLEAEPRSTLPGDCSDAGRAQGITGSRRLFTSLRIKGRAFFTFAGAKSREENCL